MKITTQYNDGLSIVSYDTDHGEWSEVHMVGFHFPLASFDDVEDAEDMVSNPEAIAKAKGDMVLWVTENYTAADIVKYNMIPICTNQPPISYR